MKNLMTTMSGVVGGIKRSFDENPYRRIATEVFVLLLIPIICIFLFFGSSVPIILSILASVAADFVATILVSIFLFHVYDAKCYMHDNDEDFETAWKKTRRYIDEPN